MSLLRPAALRLRLRACRCPHCRGTCSGTRAPGHSCCVARCALFFVCLQRLAKSKVPQRCGMQSFLHHVV